MFRTAVGTSWHTEAATESRDEDVHFPSYDIEFRKGWNFTLTTPLPHVDNRVPLERPETGQWTQIHVSDAWRHLATEHLW
jgi:hypothetical protein